MIYAVNKRTKAHEVMDPNALYNTAVWEEVHADPDGWIEWPGGECPLPDGVRFDAKMRDGMIALDEPPIERAAWRHEWGEADIIAYRPILDSGTKPAECAECEGVRLTAFGDDCPACCKPEPSAWDGEGLPPAGCECEVEYAELGNWIRAKVIGYDGPACVVAIDGHGYFGSRNPSEFRPILNADTKVSHPGTMAGPDKFRADGGEPPARDGSGMPRAGSLACTSGGDCEVVTTDAARGQVCVRWNDGELGVVPIGVVKPRPIRSEEDRAVDAMWAAYERGDRKGGRPETMREVYRAIRDGKVPGVKLAGGE